MSKSQAIVSGNQWSLLPKWERLVSFTPILQGRFCSQFQVPGTNSSLSAGKYRRIIWSHIRVHGPSWKCEQNKSKKGLPKYDFICIDGCMHGYINSHTWDFCDAHLLYGIYLTTLRSQQAITRSEGKDSTIRFSQRQGAPQTTSNYIAYN